MKRTIQIICMAAVVIILVSTALHATAGSLLTEDFESDPGWTSGDPSNVRWDSSGFYRARVTDADTVARWGYSPLFTKVDSQSFSLEFDMRPTDPDWGTYPLFALILDGVAAPHEVGSLRVEAHWSGDGVKKFLLGSSQAPDIRIGWSPTFDTDTWYRHTIQYNAGSEALTWSVSIRDSGLPFHSDAFSGVTLTPFNQAAIGYQGLPPVYGGWAEIYVDNIELTPEPATPPEAPVAEADGPYSVWAGDPLILNGSGSMDPDGEIVSYLWDLDNDGDFETDAGNQPFFVVDYEDVQDLDLAVGDRYDIHLKVTDSTGLFDTDSSSLRVVPEPATLSLLTLGGLALIRRRKRRACK